MQLQFIGAAHEVTGSATLLTTSAHRLLIDCGMEQGADTYENAQLPVAASAIDAVFLTHAHIDHTGKLPLLVKEGFRGPIITTAATAQLCRIMLLDSAHIQEFEAEWRNRKARRQDTEPYEPLYTADDVNRTLALLRPCGYDEDVTVFDDVTVRLTDAGHLLGSASVHLTVREPDGVQTVLFSGDVGNVDRPLIRDPRTPPAADSVVIESTYGDRLHAERPDYVTHLTNVLRRTFARGGNVVVPCFAVGRTQELLYLLRHIKEENLLPEYPHFPVWVDSPLAVEATGIYAGDMLDYYDEETLALLREGKNPIRFPDLELAVSSDDSRRINADSTPKVILSASGMCEAGRIRHHLKHNLWRPESTILFVGYQSEGTLGRKLVEGAPAVKLFGEEIRVRAAIETLEGISGHADRDMLLGWLAALPAKPQRVYVNHGADAVCDRFAALIRERCRIDTVAPYTGATYDTATGACIARGNDQPIRKQTRFAGSERSNNVFRRLHEAGRRLAAVIEKNRGGANKDLARFADQINDLCDKWDR